MTHFKSKGLTVDPRMKMSEEEWNLPYKEPKINKRTYNLIIKFLNQFQ